ncbi:MAG: response regulator [Lachnospiraceae bacterium]|nr:response regulator [Lachnospiraceae bacterium]
MDNDKKPGLYEVSAAAVKICLYISLIFTVYIFVYYGIINVSDPIKNEPVQFIKNWTVLDEDDDSQTMIATLPVNIKSGEYIFFDTRKDVEVYINGELRKDFIEERDINMPGGASKRFLMSVPLEEADSYAEIVIKRIAVLEFDKNIPEVLISTRSGAIHYLLRTGGVSVVLSFIVLIFAFVSFLVSIALRIIMKQRIDMMYGSLGIFSIAAWLITDSFIVQFIFGVNHVNGLLSFIYCLIIPLGLALYLFNIQGGRYKKAKSFVLIVATLNAVIWPILHFTKILPFYYIINPLNSILVLLAVVGITILVVDSVRGNTSNYHYTFIGFLGFLVACLIELINIIFKLYFIRETVLIVIGLAFLLTFIVIQQVHDLRMINMEKQHAIDISEAKTRFLASMSHEIRTPINAILGMNEMIIRENNDSEIDDYARSIKSSGKMLLMLVNDVLDFTKIESGKLEIKEADFLMSDMLYDVISLISERAEEKSLELKTEIVDEIPNELISDEFRLRQVLVNLMNNAVKYTDTGSVTLMVGGNYLDDGYELKLAIKDTGKGIRKEDQDNLFEAFSRADVKSNINIEGTGLGLAIVKSIVDSMNGECGVDSEYGVGSVFWVNVPVRYENKEPLKKDFLINRNQHELEAETSSFTAPDAMILAVDDNQSNLTIVKLFLKQNGIVPDICSSGLRAVELCKEKKYDLILLDHMMPEPDGIETLRLIKNTAESLNKDTKAIVLTANAVAGSRQMYIKEGFDDYLTKPLDSKLLEETVKNMLPKEKVIDNKMQADKAEDEANEGAKSKTDTSRASGNVDNKIESTASSPVTNEVSTPETNKDSDLLKQASLEDKLKSIDGLDYNIALRYSAGNEELLREIVKQIVNASSDRIARMRDSIKAKDLKAYRIDSHSVKSEMATIGMNEYSELAKKHEFAARDEDLAFVEAEGEEFIDGFAKICEQLSEALK